MQNSKDVTDFSISKLFDNCPHLTEVDDADSSVTEFALLKVIDRNTEFIHIGYENSSKVSVDLTVFQSSTRTQPRGVMYRTTPWAYNNKNLTLFTVAAICPNLLEFTLSGHPVVTDEVLVHILNACPMIRKLRLLGNANISAEVLTDITEKCLHLTCFEFTSVDDLSDVLLVEFLEKRGPQLTVLSVEGNKLLTDTSMTMAVKLCPFLTKLSVEGGFLMCVLRIVVDFTGLSIPGFGVQVVSF